MGNRSSLLLREEEIAQIQAETGCKYTERRFGQKNFISGFLRSYTKSDRTIIFKVHVVG